MDITPAATAAATQTATSAQTTAASSETAFADALSQAASQNEASASSAAGKADLVSGRLGIDYKDMGVPYRVVYFDENGQTLTTSPFDAASILELSDKFGIDLNDLTGLGEQLDALDVGYRPYELYPGTGSDHGIDFADLIDGGLGTAYDWREDANVALKGASGRQSLEHSRALADRLGLEADPSITDVDETAAETTDAAATSATSLAATADETTSVAAGDQTVATAETDAVDDATTVAATEETTPLAAEEQTKTVVSTSETSETTDSTATGQADIVSGRLGIDYKDLGVPYRVVYFDENGETLTTSPFDAASILELSDKFGIDLNDLTSLGEQLDALDVGYRPYELYPGTGSDHGIDFADLVDGGLGTAYDWREDANVALKGPSGRQSLEHARELAERLGVERHDDVTTGGGIDPSRFASMTASDGLRSYVAYGGGVASWYATAEQASQYADSINGQVTELAAQVAAGSVTRQRLAASEAAGRSSTAIAV